MQTLFSAKRIVLKLGTQVVIQPDGKVAEVQIRNLIDQVITGMRQGKQFLIVSSGAVGLGRMALGLGNNKLTLAEKQACAAVGQARLMDLYRKLFEPHQLTPAQLLLTAYDFSERQRYLNLRETMEKLLELNVVPIINENDTVSTMELEAGAGKSFGDNDKLSALVASKLDADLLVILTNVDGIYTENPLTHPDAQKIPIIAGLEALDTIITDGMSAMGRGGMATKIEAARIAAISGIDTLITSGLTPTTLNGIITNDSLSGTLVQALQAQTALHGRKRWLGSAAGFAGVVIVNTGAKDALLQRQASLLPSGIVDVEGDFKAKQVVSIQDRDGLELGRGVSNFSAQDTRQIQGCQSAEIAQRLGRTETDVVIHRDNLVIYQEYRQ